MSSTLGSGSRLVPSLLAAASGLAAAAVVGATSYLLFGSGSFGPPQTPAAAALRYAHLLHAGDIKNLDDVVCDGIQAQPVAQAWPWAGVAWRLEPGQLASRAAAFTFEAPDGVRHLRVATMQARTGWCVTAVQPS